MNYQMGNRAHTPCLQSLLMNAADLSDQLKDWGSVKKTAVSIQSNSVVYLLFYCQRTADALMVFFSRCPSSLVHVNPFFHLAFLVQQQLWYYSALGDGYNLPMMGLSTCLP